MKPITDKYFIVRDGVGFVEAEDAQPVRVRGFEGLDLFACRSLDNPSQFVLCEGITGLRCSSGSRTPLMSIYDFIEVTKRRHQTKQTMLSSVNDMIINRDNISPRYRKDK